jgi:hypothetical protein
MKIKIGFTIDIDPTEWSNKHRVLFPNTHRDSVKLFFEQYCKEYARFTGTGEQNREPKDLR